MSKFGELIREKREEKGLLLREVAYHLQMDTALLSKIERGERNAQEKHLPVLADILELNLKEIKTLWLADKIYQIVEEDENALDALSVVEEEIIYKKRKNTSSTK